MAQYDSICDEAICNYGLISTERAAELGVHRKELYDWVRLGRMEKCGRGLYRIAHYLWIVIWRSCFKGEREAVWTINSTES